MKILGIAGWKNTGKTGLVERLVTEFTRRGLTVSTVKHAHHAVEIDQPGTDSFRHREAGAHEVLLSTAHRFAVMHENRGAAEPDLARLLARLAPVDLVLVEGFKAADIPKIETYRAACGQAPLAPTDVNVLAIASDAPVEAGQRPVLALDDTGTIADFIERTIGLDASGMGGSGGAIATDLPSADDVLERLRSDMSAAVASETVSLDAAAGRILAQAATARRANPPGANSAVDGWGFAWESLDEGESVVPLVEGRAAPGSAWDRPVAAGHAIRILTGALLPEGVDTVVMQEHVERVDQGIRLRRPDRAGANTRAKGEDVAAGDPILGAGRRLGPPDLAILAATGNAEVRVFKRLRVGVMSTGSELVPSGADEQPKNTYDANRPMLLAALERLGHRPVDLGIFSDDRDGLRRGLEQATGRCDAILTSGGASAGDEDHVAALLTSEGTLLGWRVAIKPGRPLVLGRWQGVPVFGLPGNPVAALVCALVFARPALEVLAGGTWPVPRGFDVPAAFSKDKHAGRTEFLRARINAEGHAEAFGSEGSGRISGLSWAEGLIRLDPPARRIRPGDRVHFLPYAAFGL